MYAKVKGKHVDDYIAHTREVRHALAFHSSRAWQRVLADRATHYDKGRTTVTLQRGDLLDMHIVFNHRDGPEAARAAAFAMDSLGAVTGRATLRPLPMQRRRSKARWTKKSGSRMNRR